MRHRVVSSVLGLAVGVFSAVSAQGQTREAFASQTMVQGTIEPVARASETGALQGGTATESIAHRFSFFAMWGLDNTFAGNMIKQADGQTTGGVPINLVETTFDEVYGRMGLFKVGVAYRMKPRMELIANVAIERSGAQQVNIGSVSVARVPLPVQFDDYSYKGVEVGQDFYFAKPRFTPYVGYLLGLNRHDDIRGVFVNVPPSLTPGLAEADGKFFERSWAFSIGPTGGVLFPVGPIEIIVEAQLRYMGGLSDVDWLVEEGLKDINTESARWSVPILFGGRFRLGRSH